MEHKFILTMFMQMRIIYILPYLKLNISLLSVVRSLKTRSFNKALSLLFYIFMHVTAKLLPKQ